MGRIFCSYFAQIKIEETREENKMYKSMKQPVRKWKGHSLLKWAEDYVLVDIETTGLSPTYNDIIEIGAIKVKGNEIVDTYESLIKIEEPLSPFITHLTGITDKMLEKGKEREEVLQEFIEFAGEDILIGHNVNFDINFLYDKCEKYIDTYLTNDFIDTMRLARKILPNSPNYQLRNTSQRARNSLYTCS